jgi:SNF2 family DNA or RNA helicase
MGVEVSLETPLALAAAPLAFPGSEAVNEAYALVQTQESLVAAAMQQRAHIAEQLLKLSEAAAAAEAAAASVKGGKGGKGGAAPPVAAEPAADEPSKSAEELQAELDAGRLDRPSLVVVPTSLLENWLAEAKRFTPQLRMLVLHGKHRAQQFKSIARAHVVVTSYPLAVRDMAALASHAWHYLVLDEAQRIKNSRSQATLSLKALNARHRLCLSGTPLENHLGELWSLMDFVSPGLLGNEAQFREHYRNPIEKRQETLQAEHLARRVRPFILRRTKLQVAQDLPEKTETLLRVELDGMQRDMYETVRATMKDYNRLDLSI